MKFGSVCSGIEAASVAWKPLGWEAAWFSEIEKFPCEVLKHHYPTVDNLGDMTKISEMILSEKVEAPDILCGGTPCQAFSVAGNRKSLDDDRGNLSLTFCKIADAIDTIRVKNNEKESIIFWENVPGVLSTHDNAFGCFLGELAGNDSPVIPAGKKWTNAGCVYGPKRAVAWRVLDAQYFGLAQRRKRVFVVASARESFDPAKILFESEGLRRDIKPSREKRKEITTDVICCFEQRSPDGVARVSGEISPTLNTMGGGQREPCVITTASGKDIFPTLMANAGSKMWLGNQEAFSGDYSILHPMTYAIVGNTIGRKPENGGNGDGWSEDLMYTLTATDVHGVVDPVAYAFDSLSSNSMKSNNPISGCREVDISNTIDTTIPCPSKNQGGIGIVQQFNDSIGCDVYNGSITDDIACTLTTCSGSEGGSGPNVISKCFQQNTRDEVRYINGDGDIVGALVADAGAKQQNYVHQISFRDVTDCLSSAYGTKWNGNASADNGSLFVLSNQLQEQVIGCDGTVDGPVPPLMARSSRGGSQTLSPGHQTDGHMILAPTCEVTGTISCNAVEPMHDVAPCLAKADQHGVVYSFDSLSSNSMKSNNPNSRCRKTDLAKTLDTTTPEPSKNQGGIGVVHPVDFRNVIAPTLTTNDPSRSPQSSEVTNQVNAVYQSSMQVRRLTPTECERLQGFPDGYTDIKPKGKDTPDGPRYKALGNSWAVPVVRWIGQRIQIHDNLPMINIPKNDLSDFF